MKASDAIAKASDAIAKASDAIAKASDAIAKASDAIAKASDAIASDAIAKKAKASDAIASDAIASLPKSNPGKNLETDAKTGFAAKAVIASVFDENGQLRGCFVEIPKVLPISTAQPDEGQKPMSTELSTGGDDKLSTIGQSEGGLPANLKEKGVMRKENIPPCTPYKRKEIPLKEKAVAVADSARACEGLPPDRDSPIAKVEAYRRELKANIAPAFFVDYYLSGSDGWPRYWKSRFRNWLKQDKREGRICPKDLAKQAGTAPAVKTDWTLCAEQCASCNGDGCKRGYSIPPACHPEHPRPPEECPKFTAKEA